MIDAGVREVERSVRVLLVVVALTGACWRSASLDQEAAPDDDADTGADTGTDGDSDAECPFVCLDQVLCDVLGGTVHDEYECDVLDACCETYGDTDSDTGPETPDCDPATEVAYQGKCYYLNGSHGICEPGYELGPQSVLFEIGPLFEGKDYHYNISANCCIYNSEEDEDFGMAVHCNLPGPFTADDVAYGASGCLNEDNLYPQQLTLCQTAD